MTYDLRRELDALGADERAAAPDLAVDGLATRAHRRRAMRAAATSAVAVVAVGAITVAAVALPRWTTPPPVTTPSPSPTATAFPPQEWTAVTADGEFACGEPVPRIIDPEGEADLHFEAVARTTSGAEQALDAGREPSLTATVGDWLSIRAALVNGTGGELSGLVPGKEAARLRSWITQDGRVVGGLGGVTLTFEELPPVEIILPAGGRAPEELVSGWPRTWCVPEVAAGERNGYSILRAGIYQVYLTETIWAGPESLETGEPAVTVVGGPFDLIIEEPAA